MYKIHTNLCIIYIDCNKLKIINIFFLYYMEYINQLKERPEPKTSNLVEVSFYKIVLILIVNIWKFILKQLVASGSVITSLY